MQQHSKATRNYALDALKVIAILCIVCHHYQQDSGLMFAHGINFYKGNFSMGYLVELFFILSGLFMVKYIDRIKQGTTLASFYLKRALRLLPLMAVAAVAFEAMVLLWGAVFHEPMGRYTFDLAGMVLASLGMQAGWMFENHMVNNPTWYICVLLLCYLVFWLATKIASKLQISEFILYAAIIGVGLLIWRKEIDLPFINYYAGRGYVAFFVGVFVGKALTKITVGNVIAVVCSVIVVIFGVSTAFFPQPPWERFTLAFVVFPALVIALHHPLAARVFKFPWIGTAAQISFDVYIWHTVLYKVMLFGLTLTGCPQAACSGWMLLLFLTACAAFGTFSFRFIEMPIDRKIKSTAFYKKLQ